MPGKSEHCYHTNTNSANTTTTTHIHNRHKNGITSTTHTNRTGKQILLIATAGKIIKSARERYNSNQKHNRNHHRKGGGISNSNGSWLPSSHCCTQSQSLSQPCSPSNASPAALSNYLRSDSLFNQQLAHSSAIPSYDILEWPQVLERNSMEVSDILHLVKDIEQHYLDYEGFVILTNVQTMAYTASYLSFMIENLAKPIVLTDAYCHLMDMFTDARANLLASLIVANNAHIHEICIVWNKKIFRGNRVSRYSEFSANQFISHNYPLLGTFEPNLTLNPLSYNKHRVTKGFRVFTNICKNIIVIELTPLLTEAMLKRILFAALNHRQHRTRTRRRRHKRQHRQTQQQQPQSQQKQKQQELMAVTATNATATTTTKTIITTAVSVDASAGAAGATADTITDANTVSVNNRSHHDNRPRDGGKQLEQLLEKTETPAVKSVPVMNGHHKSLMRTNMNDGSPMVRHTTWATTPTLSPSRAMLRSTEVSFSLGDNGAGNTNTNTMMNLNAMNLNVSAPSSRKPPQASTRRMSFKSTHYTQAESRKGIILSFFGVGNAPERKSFRDLLIQAQQRFQCEIVVTAQPAIGTVNLSMYGSGHFFSDSGLISAMDMTMEATVAKLAYLMGKGLAGAELKERFETDLRGELTEDHVKKKKIIKYKNNFSYVITEESGKTFSVDGIGYRSGYEFRQSQSPKHSLSNSKHNHNHSSTDAMDNQNANNASASASATSNSIDV